MGNIFTVRSSCLSGPEASHDGAVGWMSEWNHWCIVAPAGSGRFAWDFRAQMRLKARRGTEWGTRNGRRKQWEVMPVRTKSERNRCDNLTFHRRAAVDELTERLLDMKRTIGQPKKITTISGRKVTKEYNGKLQTVIEDLDLPNPVIRSHYGHGFAKQYVRDGRLPRTEPATNDVRDYGVNKRVEHLPYCAAACQRSSIITMTHSRTSSKPSWTAADSAGTWPNQPGSLNGKRIPGLKLVHALVRFANLAAGSAVTTADLYVPALDAPGADSQILAGVVSLRPLQTPRQRTRRKSAAVPALPVWWARAIPSASSSLNSSRNSSSASMHRSRRASSRLFLAIANAARGLLANRRLTPQSDRSRGTKFSLRAA